MPLRPGATRRPNGTPTVLMQAHVHPDVRERAKELAGAAGVSLSAYLERLIANERADDQGRPVWWPADDEQEELPLKTA
jgi:hypothetical protein